MCLCFREAAGKGEFSSCGDSSTRMSWDGDIFFLGLNIKIKVLEKKNARCTTLQSLSGSDSRVTELRMPGHFS